MVGISNTIDRRLSMTFIMNPEQYVDALYVVLTHVIVVGIVVVCVKRVIF